MTGSTVNNMLITLSQHLLFLNNYFCHEEQTFNWSLDDTVNYQLHGQRLGLRSPSTFTHPRASTSDCEWVSRMGFVGKEGETADSGGDGIKSPSVRGGSPVKPVSRPSDAGSDGWSSSTSISINSELVESPARDNWGRRRGLVIMRT